MVKTGDLAVKVDGWFYLNGRANRVLMHRGRKIDLDQIENTLTRIGVEAAVVPEEKLVCIIKEPVPPNVQRRLHLELPPYAVPDTWRTVETLPKTRSGRYDRTVLQRLAERIPSDLAGELWRGVLRGGACSDSAQFFDSGGDSLAAIELLAALKAAGVKVPLKAFLGNPTLGFLRMCVTDFRGEGAKEKVAVIADIFRGKHLDSVLNLVVANMARDPFLCGYPLSAFPKRNGDGKANRPFRTAVAKDRVLYKSVMERYIHMRFFRHLSFCNAQIRRSEKTRL